MIRMLIVAPLHQTMCIERVTDHLFVHDITLLVLSCRSVSVLITWSMDHNNDGLLSLHAIVQRLDVFVVEGKRVGLPITLKLLSCCVLVRFLHL